MGTLESNINGLRLRYPDYAARVESAEPAPHDTDPLNAAEIAQAHEPPKWGCVIFIGSGPHVPAIIRRSPDQTLFLIFEPDPGKFRAMLTHEDCGDWLSKTNWRIIDKPDDEQAVFRALNAAGFVPAQGVKLIHNKNGYERLRPVLGTFTEMAARAFRNWRLEMVSALTLPDKTQRNALCNMRRYIDSDGIADLELRYKGMPGITVAAGPSLHRNLEHLARPHVRESFVIVAVQTALKPMLAAGVRPHFVVALDYHPISQRFYDGITAEAVDGVELVCLTAAAPIIPLMWPGRLRMPFDGFLGGILAGSTETANERGQLPPASSVAHMSYNFARYLGCDPVILVGQDLAYTDGTYYGKKAAIHEAWACEVNAFNSIEKMETERCLRGGDSLLWRLDQDGRPVRTDLQLDGYRVRFEQQFAEDVSHGLRVIDATEGGAVKQYAERMALSKVVEQFAGVPA